MDKKLNQAIIVHNKFLKRKIEENQLAYNRQGNYCVKWLSQKKKSILKISLNFFRKFQNHTSWKKRNSDKWWQNHKGFQYFFRKYLFRCTTLQ